MMRELPLHLISQYWDALIAHPRGIADFHAYFFVAFITSFTDRLVKMEFEDCIMFLQHMPTRTWTDTNIVKVIAQARLWEQSIDIASLSD